METTPPLLLPIRLRMTHGLSAATIRDLKHLREGWQLALAQRSEQGEGEGEVHSASEEVPARGGFSAYGAATQSIDWLQLLNNSRRLGKLRHRI